VIDCRQEDRTEYLQTLRSHIINFVAGESPRIRIYRYRTLLDLTPAWGPVMDVQAVFQPLAKDVKRKPWGIGIIP
jgi:hypothetical protein